MNIYETLNRAADLIEERGWTMGSQDPAHDPWGLGGGPVCIEGAIYAAVGIDQDSSVSLFVNECPAGRAVRDYLDIEFDDRIWAYNDVPDRTAAEVIEVLRAAAATSLTRESTPAEHEVEAVGANV